MNIAKLKQQYWHTRSAREQKSLLLAAWVALPIMAYALLWQPASQQTQKLEKQLPELRQQAAQLQLDAIEIQKLRHAQIPAVLDANTLRNTIEETATRHGIREQITSINNQNNNAMQLNVDAVPFSQWLGFLRELQQTQHIRLLNTSIASLPQTGYVKISAVLISGQE